ncbi:1-deoxy-D-xylulose-5-phosphate synthase [Cellulomonas sp. zg-ZUI222]|uniref:1-deoxy-D-xylulose-5-phosphate synthase n=1 Tax=Cellulomonas wangleii TaxID=2816956 RepID=A0ABX8D8Z4_9CELL|nr:MULTISPECIES: 1-deoxy-D-xylulose-5-phosphate synthase [Cellulomonas]MBO0900491.1 1-deoxy-D-xylulose-5-phosphate synthase [Cellulomonas sp. zg-ZUI22]MBO0922679.1 1-deoxy-D-xylulose-5-phosphate synthase [Cellulomonas wangleii]MBO0926456.1 1-deoxy-D-xylulose-5-phosphate synthase [Cellulomonas wangleii]QVI63876.1 1-deoxy-D-xylulose-5-phosphate synthase [Cellulomonas wangleii]
MGLLERISSPQDVRRLTTQEVDALAEEIREFLVDQVSRTGGHLGPNLGVVELSIALHRVFDSPRDTIVFDTGHQAYVHKLLTGRQDFTSLRRRGGMSGYPSRSESEHDVVENSHASTALSWADGIAKARQLRGESDRHTVAVIGDGALTGGMAWEALNNIAAGVDRRLVIVVNDNGRSYAPTIGGLAQHLDSLRTTQGYESVLTWGKTTLRRSGPPGRLAYEALHGLKKGIKDVVAPQGMFEDLGLKYIGPVDGHDEQAVERALRRARAFGGPVIVHVITEKGRGYTPAEQDVADRFHAVGVIHPETGLPLAPSRFGWTSVFADEIVRVGRRRPDVVAITAAMLQPVGLAPFAAEFPERVFDVGIAEQHAATSAAGMAFAGLHPVVAVYATFLNRAFDQVLMDVALHRAGVTFVLDRAGITGDDGASHNGMWDLAMLSIVPGLRLAAPRDEPTLRAALRQAVDIDDAPSVVRYPKGSMGDPVPAIEDADGVDVLARHEGAGTRVLVVGIGAMVSTALAVGELLAADGTAVTVVDPRWVLPVPAALVKLVGDHDHVVTLEDGLVDGGIGALLAQRAREANVPTPVQSFGVPAVFLEHASRDEVIDELRLTPHDVAGDVLAALRARG